MNDLSQLRARRDEAKALIEEPAFKVALERMKERLRNELMVAESNDRKLEIVAQLKTADAIAGELQSLINDYTMAKRREGHG